MKDPTCLVTSPDNSGRMCSLLDTPWEIRFQILFSPGLTYQDILSLCFTCKDVSLILSDPFFWKKMFFRFWGETSKFFQHGNPGYDVDPKTLMLHLMSSEIGVGEIGVGEIEVGELKVDESKPQTKGGMTRRLKGKIAVGIYALENNNFDLYRWAILKSYIPDELDRNVLKLAVRLNKKIAVKNCLNILDGAQRINPLLREAGKHGNLEMLDLILKGPRHFYGMEVRHFHDWWKKSCSAATYGASISGDMKIVIKVTNYMLNPLIMKECMQSLHFPVDTINVNVSLFPMFQASLRAASAIGSLPLMRELLLRLGATDDGNPKVKGVFFKKLSNWANSNGEKLKLYSLMKIRMSSQDPEKLPFASFVDTAARNGHLNCVRYLMEKVKIPSTDKEDELKRVETRRMPWMETFKAVAKNGSVEVMKYLLAKCGPMITYGGIGQARHPMLVGNVEFYLRIAWNNQNSEMASTIIEGSQLPKINQKQVLSKTVLLDGVNEQKIRWLIDQGEIDYRYVLDLCKCDVIRNRNNIWTQNKFRILYQRATLLQYQ